MDKDNNGKITREKRLQVLKEIFQLTDKDQDGIITADELKTVLLLFNKKPTDSDVYLILKKYDHDNSGAIDFNEFVNIMNEKISEENEILEFINIFQGFVGGATGAQVGSKKTGDPLFDKKFDDWY